MIYFTCYDLARKDRDTLLKSVENESHRTILHNMEYLDQDMLSSENKKLKRRREEMTTEQFNDFSRRLAASEYEILRSEPVIVQVIRSIHENTLDTKAYPYIGEKPEPKKVVPKKAPKPEPVKKKGAASMIEEDEDDSKQEEAI